jgi:hypothetical protein
MAKNVDVSGRAHEMRPYEIIKINLILSAPGQAPVQTVSSGKSSSPVALWHCKLAGVDYR